MSGSSRGSTLLDPPLGSSKVSPVVYSIMMYVLSYHLFPNNMHRTQGRAGIMSGSSRGSTLLDPPLGSSNASPAVYSLMMYVLSYHLFPNNMHRTQGRARILSGSFRSSTLLDPPLGIFIAVVCVVVSSFSQQYAPLVDATKIGRASTNGYW